MRRQVQCRACRAGDCDDCIRHTYEGAGCDHLCADKRQLGLFAADIRDFRLDAPPPVADRPEPPGAGLEAGTG